MHIEQSQRHGAYQKTAIAMDQKKTSPKGFD